jgi:hypothetical protein
MDLKEVFSGLQQNDKKRVIYCKFIRLLY